MPELPTLVLFAKYPVPGFAKTRLIPALGADGAAMLHRQLAERTVKVLLATGLPVEVQFTGAPKEKFQAWLGTTCTFIEQVEGDLTDRLLAASRDRPHIFFGADTPDLTTDIVQAAAAALAQHKVVIGPAEDGGYYLIGMQTAMPALLHAMPWSTDQVLPETLRRLTVMGVTPAFLPQLSDCDRPEDLTRWPDLLASL